MPENNLNAALGAARKLNLKSSVAAALEEMGDLAVIQDALEQAESNYEESLKIRSEIGERGGVAAVWLSQPALELERENLTRAKELAQRAINEFHIQHNDDQEAAARGSLAKAEILQGSPQAAQEQVDLVRKLRSKTERFSCLSKLQKRNFQRPRGRRLPPFATRPLLSNGRNR